MKMAIGMAIGMVLGIGTVHMVGGIAGPLPMVPAAIAAIGAAAVGLAWPRRRPEALFLVAYIATIASASMGAV